jgi:hypothetical protein
VFTFGLVDGFDLIGFLDFDFEFNQDFLDELQAAQPDAMGLDEVKVDEGKVQNAGFATFTPGPIDVTIQDGGLTAAFGATFEVTEVDPEIDVTPGSPLTPAVAPTVSQVIAAGDNISMLVADDVFNQVRGHEDPGKLKAVCQGGDGLTVGSLPPADCETLGPPTSPGPPRHLPRRPR